MSLLRLAAAGALTVLLSAVPALAQIAFVKTIGTNTSTTTGTTLSITVPAAGVAAGNFVAVAIGTRASGAVSCTDSKGNVYSVDITATNASGTVSQTAVCTANITTALVSGNTITVTHPSTSTRTISANEFSGVASSCAFDKYSGANAGGTFGTAPSSGVTRSTGQGNELLIGAIGTPGGTSETFTPGAGWTLAGRAGTSATGMSIDPMYQIVSSTGVYATTATLGVAHTWGATISTYRSATVPQAGATKSLSFGAPNNDYVSIPDSTSTSPGALTLEAWVKPAAFTASVNWISIAIKASSTAWSDGYGMYISTDASANATLNFWVTNQPTNQVSSGTTYLQSGQWSHVAGTYDGANLNLYINGNLVGTFAYAGGLTYVAGAALTLGNNAGGTPFNGEIDEVRVWNVAQTQAAIQANMHITNLPASGSLAGYWMADDAGCGTTATDSSGNLNTGTLNAADQGAWNTSTAPLGPNPNGAFDNVTTAVSVGPAGGTVQGTITSVPDNANNVGLYQFGSTTGAALSAGETFPAGVVSRSNIVWGVVSRGTVTANLFIDYSGIGGIINASTVKLLSRADANTMTWTLVTPTSRDDINNTMTLSGQTTFGVEYAIGFQTAPTAVTLTSFTATQYDRGVLLEWRTGYEINNLGFNVYRDGNSQRTKLTSSLVAGSGLTVGSGTAVSSTRAYSWWDLGTNATAASAPVTYWVQDVDFDGTATWHGPVTPVPGGDLVPLVAMSNVLTGLGAPENVISNVPLTHGEPIGRRWGPGEGPIAGQSIDPHDGGLFVTTRERIETQWRIAGLPGVKIGIRAPGWYRVSQPDLIAAGLDPNVDPHTLRLFAEGVEQALLVSGEESGRFGPNDAIEFYGSGVDTPYTDARVYWLVSGGERGRRIVRRDSQPGSSLSSPASFWVTRQRKDRSIYFAALETGDSDNWFGPVISSAPTDFTMQLENLDAAAPTTAELEVTLQGVTSNVRHQVQLLVNGAVAGVLTFDGQSSGRTSIDVQHSLLTEGPNTITMVALGGDPDITLFDTVHLSYWHTYRADADRLWATVAIADAGAPASGSQSAAGSEAVTLGGFNSPNVRVMDLTDPTSPVELRVAATAEASGTWAAALRAPGTLFAFTGDTVGTPAFVESHRPTNWHDSSQAADYVVITDKSFRDSLGALTALHTQEGHTVAVVDVDDAYAEFSFGEKTPRAIKDLLWRAETTWRQRPRFVLLVGDATIDPRDYAGLGNADFVPTRQVPMTRVALKTASDDWFVDFSDGGLPDIAVGRLPVRTVAQVQATVSKIVSYIGAGGDVSWTKDVLLVADQNDLTTNFEANSTALHALLPAGYRAHDVFRGQLGANGAHQALLDAVNQGQVLVDYQGHGSVQLWGDDGGLLTNQDVYNFWRSIGRLPFVIAMDCLNGLFDQVWDEESLAEALLRAPQGGAIAVWASSSLTLPTSQAPVNQELFKLIFQGKFATLGEAVAAAKRVSTDVDLRRSLIFFGDPALHISGAPWPSGTTSITATTITTVALMMPTPLASRMLANSTSNQQPALDASAARAFVEATAVRLADLTGEGRATVLVYAPSTGAWSTPSTSGIGGRRSGQWNANGQVVAAHLALHRQADLVFYDPATGYWVQTLNTGTDLQPVGQAPGVRQGQVQVGDFTGAGHDDVLTYAPASGEWVLGVNDGNGGLRTTWSGTWPAVARVRVADITGDGRADVIGYDSTTGQGFVAQNQGNGRFTVTRGAWGAGWQLAVGDLNGDGRADLFFYHPVSGIWIESLSDGLGGFTSWSGSWPSGLVVQLTDLNGDGRDDVVGYNPATGDRLIALTGDPGAFAIDSDIWAPGFIVATGDLRGLGHGDIVLYDSATGGGFDLNMVAPGNFDVRADTWMSGGVLVGAGVASTVPAPLAAPAFAGLLASALELSNGTLASGDPLALASGPAVVPSPPASPTSPASPAPAAAPSAVPDSRSESGAVASETDSGVESAPATVVTLSVGTQDPGSVATSMPLVMPIQPQTATPGQTPTPGSTSGNAASHMEQASFGKPVGTWIPSGGPLVSSMGAEPTAPVESTEPTAAPQKLPAAESQHALVAVHQASTEKKSTGTSETKASDSQCSQPPGRPSQLAATVKGSTVTFTWSASAGMPRSYFLEAESTSKGGNLAVADTGGPETMYVASSVSPGVYSVRLRARNACGVSAPSSQIVVTVP